MSGAERLIPFGLAVGMMEEAMREAMVEAGYLTGSAEAVTRSASARLERLLDALDAVEDG
ncbi:hypothetical protein LO762_01070 [Actinocorallia sp. API 0066]|uniref:hypothetical protein n=1 Tax=Actinocorallia sp. API 0066 TaxID=2896846 RepID=UPI001E427441|nr:hypothetical protein [Actinocorallia sp. API 0066]MCD0447792.1 hypothetical protein [Actinocorallia sp. API 0066]